MRTYFKTTKRGRQRISTYSDLTMVSFDDPKTFVSVWYHTPNGGPSLWDRLEYVLRDQKVQAAGLEHVLSDHEWQWLLKERDSALVHCGICDPTDIMTPEEWSAYCEGEQRK